MRICIVNQSRSRKDREVLPVVSAINLQLVEFAYHWSVLAQLRLEGSRGRSLSLKELRGDAIIYLRDEPDDDEGALGWHEADKYGVPYGVVYTDIGGEPWSVTLSHEALELLLDPHANRLAKGPHPTKGYTVFHWYEACDAVQACTYRIGGVEVSDYVLPAYFTEGEEKGMRLSYLGENLKSFGVAPGGYIGFYDPVLGEHEAHFADDAGNAAYQRKRHGRVAKYRSGGRPPRPNPPQPQVIG